MKKTDKNKILIVAIDCMILAVCFFAKDLSEIMMKNLRPCGVYKTFGIKCLTCGGTRCVNALFSGKIKEAFAYNSYVVMAGIVLFIVLVLVNAGWVFEKEKARRIVVKLCCVKTVVILGVLTLTFMLGRNLYPVFLYLANR